LNRATAGLAIANQYESAGDFDHDLAFVVTKDGTAYINTKGAIVRKSKQGAIRSGANHFWVFDLCGGQTILFVPMGLRPTNRDESPDSQYPVLMHSR
jgi:hypothetical protein